MLGKFKTALVLVIIGAISGFLIWGTNELTNEDIALNRELREQGYYKDIFGLEETFEISFEKNNISESLEEIVLKDIENSIIGYIYKGADKNNYGDIIVLVGVTGEGKISNVLISSSTNTPTYVKGVKDDQLSPFVDQFADSVEYDAKTSATFTYGSVTKIVGEATDYYLANRGGE
jgi:electron transport complex protein RnfG